MAYHSKRFRALRDKTAVDPVPLADAVRQESGGFDLQTLFIDEGFGTLDEESLEHVMEILDTLRDGGRAVGVVSHVVDLRSRIPTQLRVHKSTQGSSVSVVGMPA